MGRHGAALGFVSTCSVPEKMRIPGAAEAHRAEVDGIGTGEASTLLLMRRMHGVVRPSRSASARA